MHGYYLFFGRGDWGLARDQSLDPTFNGNVPTRILGDWGGHRQGTLLADAPAWSSSWSLATWQRHLDFLHDQLAADALFLLLTGYELPYPSDAFPEAVEADHQNVQTDFLQDVIDYAHHRKMQVHAVLTTTGHAVAYAREHSEYAMVASDGTRSNENLCHNNPGGRHYAETIARELLTRYHDFDGICFHPPENTSTCNCGYCQEAYHQATGAQLRDADPVAVDRFFWRQCLAFQRDMEGRAQQLQPGIQVNCITVPGRFEQRFDVIATTVPQTTRLVHWDYWSFDDRVPELLQSLELFRSAGHQVAFMPSAGWNLDACGKDYGRQVQQQIAAVYDAGIQDIIYFVGAIWNETALRTTATNI